MSLEALAIPRLLALGRERLRVVEYTDPVSVWCWGYEPTMRCLEILYADVADLEVRMGGLFEDFTPMREYWVRMSGGRWKESILTFFTAVAGRHGMPMNAGTIVDSMDDFDSTWPACIAVKAAEFQGLDEGRHYLRRLREAFLVEGRPIHRVSTQEEVAKESNLDPAAFSRSLREGSAEEAFHRDLQACRARGITGFPTLEISRGEVTVRIDGWRPWDAFLEELRTIEPTLETRTVATAEDTLLPALRRHDRWTTREVSDLTGLMDDEAEIVLDELAARGLVLRREIGAALLWEPRGASPEAP